MGIFHPNELRLNESIRFLCVKRKFLLFLWVFLKFLEKNVCYFFGFELMRHHQGMNRPIYRGVEVNAFSWVGDWEPLPSTLKWCRKQDRFSHRT